MRKAMHGFKRRILMPLVILSLPLGYQLRGNKAIEPYVETNLDPLLLKFPQYFGIQDFDRSAIEYTNSSFRSRILGSGGEFNHGNERIYLNTGFLVTPEHNLENVLAEIFTLSLAKDVRSTLKHEITHWFTYRLAKSIGVNLPIGVVQMDGKEFQLIIEGIAEYFSRPPTLDRVETKWPRQENEYLSPELTYRVGYSLVKPIIDRFGEKGIEYILLNPPKRSELTRLQEYQNRVINALSERF